jgi:hypothetical protein
MMASRLSMFKFGGSDAVSTPPEVERPTLDLSGPVLTAAFEALLAGSEDHGGIERYVEALRIKATLFREALKGVEEPGLELETFKGLCTFMPTVRRRVAVYLDENSYAEMRAAITELLHATADTRETDASVAAFCERFPSGSEYRWVRDLAAEILHGYDPGKYPLMCRWIWDCKANGGALREIWYGEDVDGKTIEVGDGYGTFLMLREELSQFLTDNGVFSDMILYINLLCAQVYADHICAQGGSYLRADFAAPDDPMQYVRRMLGLDGVKQGSGRSRLKSIDGTAFVVEDVQLLT